MEAKYYTVSKIEGEYAYLAPEDGEETTIPDDTTAQEPDTGEPETDEFGNLLGEEPGDGVTEEPEQ